MYRTTPRTSTRETHFSLTYGTEAIVPAEIGEPSWGVMNYSEEVNNIALQANLDLLEEMREKAGVRAVMYRSRMARAYNRRVRPRAFQVGDLILRKVKVM